MFLLLEDGMVEKALIPDLQPDGSACQLKAVYESIDKISEDLNAAERVWLFILRLRSALLRRVRKPVPPAPAPGMDEPVHILPAGEIAKRLDRDGRTAGLKFVPPMRAHCGKDARGLKKVNNFFDEKAWKMLKTKGIVLLDGVTCDGKGIFPGKDCDRGCHFYWHESWIGGKEQK